MTEAGIGIPMYPVGSRNEGVFTRTKKSFLITDDLRVMPTVECSDFDFLRTLVSGVDVTEEFIISVGLKEIIHLLNLTLLSTTPLTNFFQQWKSHTTITNPEQIFMANTPECPEFGKTDSSIKLKALVQKSNQKLLLLLGGDDFIEFLFRILTIPLGSVVSLLDGNSNIGSVDNLYKSISEMNCNFLASSSVKDLLINPKLPPHYLTKNLSEVLPLSEKPSPLGLVFVDPKGGPRYIKGQETFILTENLEVTPFSPISIISYLSTRNIPFPDVEESVIEIGTTEALGILNLFIQPKTEK